MMGDVETDFNEAPDVGGSDPWQQAIRAIRAVSVPMGMLRQQIHATLSKVSNADAVVTDADLSALMDNLQQMATYAAQLPQLVARAKALPEYANDAQTAAELTNWLGFVRDWAGQVVGVLQMLPADVAAWGSDQLGRIADSAGKAINRTSQALLFGLSPLVLGAIAIGALLIVGAKKAEGTRTYRRYVA